MCTLGTLLSCLLIKGLTAFIQSGLTENVKSKQHTGGITILRRFDVIGLQYAVDQIMKRLPCFFQKDTQCCFLFDANLGMALTRFGEAIA